MSRCQQRLMREGLAYPRTCAVSGLFGPCRGTIQTHYGHGTLHDEPRWKQSALGAEGRRLMGEFDEQV